MIESKKGLSREIGIPVMEGGRRPTGVNDNPYSESAFKTLKYRPDFPGRFGAIEDARNFCRNFFDWYNHEHKHSGIAMLTPYDIHYNTWQKTINQRSEILVNAYLEHPERFVKGVSKVKKPPSEVWINKPKTEEIIEKKTT